MIKLTLLIVTTILGFSGFLFFSAYGDGFASETLPPTRLGSSNVTLAISSTGPTINAPTADKQVTLRLYDSSLNPVPDVTFEIVASKDGKPLFGHIFKEDQGKITMTLVQTNSNSTSFVEENPSLLNQIFSGNSDTIDVLGPDFTAGLYKFHVEILGAYSYSNNLATPITYDLKISIPEYEKYTIYNKTYGNQTINVIAYYDRINNFQYDSDKNSIGFVMPFDWSNDNINAVSVVHQEIMIPKTFGDFMATKYDVYINGIKLPNKVISIDDYSSDDRIIHIILYKNDITSLKIQNQKPEMDYTVTPSQETGFPLVYYTRNAQYEISLSWYPPKIVAGSDTKFYFKVLDPYLNQSAVHTSYDFSLITNHKIIFEQTGVTASSQKENNTIDLVMPSNYTGPLSINFESLDGNSFAGVEFASIISPATIPEFPVASITILGIGLMLLLLHNKIKVKLNFE